MNLYSITLLLVYAADWFGIIYPVTNRLSLQHVGLLIPGHSTWHTRDSGTSMKYDQCHAIVLPVSANSVACMSIDCKLHREGGRGDSNLPSEEVAQS